ncbi:hypothetical protein fh0823_14010 [Francisella halioticida]|nr:hypothetical protein fh0823_14010 [Francisella halioticida]
MLIFYKLIMNVFIKTFSLIALGIIISACAIITNDDFVYLGHPSRLPKYQIYYDKTFKPLFFYR